MNRLAPNPHVRIRVHEEPDHRPTLLLGEITAPSEAAIDALRKGHASIAPMFRQVAGGDPVLVSLDLTWKETPANPDASFAARARVSYTSIECEVEEVRETQLLALLPEFNGTTGCIARVGVKHHQLIVATVRQLFVAEGFRCKGIGSELLDRCIRIARQSGCKSLNLTVARVNRQIIPWYIKKGFIPGHIYEDGEAVLVLDLTKSTH